MVRSMSTSLMRRGAFGLIGEAMVDGPTASGTRA
jgi:hypothetical protein